MLFLAFVVAFTRSIYLIGFRDTLSVLVVTLGIVAFVFTTVCLIAVGRWPWEVLW